MIQELKFTFFSQRPNTEQINQETIVILYPSLKLLFAALKDK